MKESLRRYYKKRASTIADLDEPLSIVAAVRAIGIEDHLRIIRPEKGERLLDVGCGPGRFLGPFGEKGGAVGVDFTLEMLDQARGTGALLVRGDAEHLPFKKGVFNIVHTAGLLGVYKSKAVGDEMTRVARSGGRVYASLPAAGSVSGVVAIVFTKLGWNPTLLDYWYTRSEAMEMFPKSLRLIGFHRLGFEPPFQRLYKNIRSKGLTRLFIFLEKNLRDKPLFRYFGARYLIELEKTDEVH